MKAKKITSRNNPTFRKLLRLLRGQGIKKYGAAFLSGPKQVREVLRDFPEQCIGVVLSQHQDIPEGAMPEGKTIYYLDANLLREIDIYGTDQPILLIKAGPFPTWSDDNWPLGCTLFVPFQDPINVGAVIRSAAAFGVSRVVMLQEASHPFHHKSTRVAGSALLRVPILKGPSIRDLGRTKVPMITLSPKGDDLGKFRFPSTFGLLPGVEGPGLPYHLKQVISLAIPMEPGIESLNAALATGVTLYSWRTQLKALRDFSRSEKNMVS